MTTATTAAAAAAGSGGGGGGAVVGHVWADDVTIPRHDSTPLRHRSAFRDTVNEVCALNCPSVSVLIN